MTLWTEHYDAEADVIYAAARLAANRTATAVRLAARRLRSTWWSR